MKLSIITVNLNNRDGLQKTIDSVVSQTFKDFEWIVIDGGSTDGSKELLEQYADHFAYWVSEPDKGIYNAMNKGIKVAKGEYLQFLNSGDWLCDETVLEQCFSYNISADIVYGNLFFVNSDGQKIKSNYPELLTFKYLFRHSIGHNASFIKRELFQKEQYDESKKIVSDWSFYLKRLLDGKQFEFIDEIITCYDTTGISSTNEELLSRERKSEIKRLVPRALIEDYQKMEDMEVLLNRDHVRKVLKYGGEKKIYHKIISGCLMFIEFLDWIVAKRSK